MNLKPLLWKLKFGIYKKWFLDAFLGASVVYLITYTIAFLLKFPALKISASIAIFYFVSEFIKNSKDDPLYLIEKQYDEISEELQTTDDTLEKDNEIVADLRKEVVSKVRRLVDFSDFFDFRILFQRVMTIFFLSFFIVFLASLNFYVPYLDVQDLLNKGVGFVEDVYGSVLADSEKISVGDGDFFGQFSQLVGTAGADAGDLEGDNIFGEAEVVQLGEEKLYVDIRPTDFEVSVDDFESAQSKYFKDEQFEDVTTVRSDLYQDTIPLKNQDIVKKYFKEITQ